MQGIRKGLTMGGGGGFSGSIDVEEIARAANERIRNAFSAGEYVLFCSLRKHTAEIIERVSSTERLKSLNYKICDEKSSDVDELIAGSAIVIIYFGEDDGWLIGCARQAMAANKSTICTKAFDAQESPPQFVIQYRIRIMPWTDVAEILAH